MKLKLFKLTALALAIQSSIAVALTVEDSEFNITNQNTYDETFSKSGTLFIADAIDINFKDNQTISGDTGYLMLSGSNKPNRVLNFKGSDSVEGQNDINC